MVWKLLLCGRGCRSLQRRCWSLQGPAASCCKTLAAPLHFSYGPDGCSHGPASSCRSAAAPQRMLQPRCKPLGTVRDLAACCPHAPGFKTRPDAL